MADFLGALNEVKPLFGVSEEVLEDCVEGGIIHYGPQVDKILKNGRDFVEQVRTGTTRLHSVLLHGPRGSGKTALAAQIALNSQFPFIKMLRAVDMVGMNEIQKIQHLQKAFTDAYKSPLNVLILDNIELIVDWVPVSIPLRCRGSRQTSFETSLPSIQRYLLILYSYIGRTTLQLSSSRSSQSIDGESTSEESSSAHYGHYIRAHSDATTTASVQGTDTYSSSAISAGAGPRNATIRTVLAAGRSESYWRDRADYRLEAHRSRRTAHYLSHSDGHAG